MDDTGAGIDSDPEGDALAIQGYADFTDFGFVTLQDDGNFEYTPLPGYTGYDHFTYQVYDSNGNFSNIANVVIAVSSVPIATDNDYAGNNQSIFVGNIISDDTGHFFDEDQSGGPLIIASINGQQLPQNGVINLASGTLIISIDGTFAYFPISNFGGWDSFSYTVTNGFYESNTANVTFQVWGVPILIDDAYTAYAGYSLDTIAAGNGVLANDYDTAGAPLLAAIMSGPANGNIVFHSDGNFLYTPFEGYVGADSFTYDAFNGYEWRGPATVSIQVLNTVPIAVNDSYVMHVGAVLDSSGTGVGVLDNDIDVIGATTGNNGLSAILIDDVDVGFLTLNADGSFVYEAQSGYVGAVTFQYAGFDGTTYGNVATVTILTTNTAPTALPEAYSVDAGLTLVVDGSNSLLANDSDIDNDTITISLLSSPQFGDMTILEDGTFTYTPYADSAESDSFSYRTFDGTAWSAPVTVAIQVNNPTPIALGNSYSVDVTDPVPVSGSVLDNDTDPRGRTLTASLVSSPTHGALAFNLDGTFTYSPYEGFAGVDSFTYRASHGPSSSTALVTIQVRSLPNAIQNLNYSVHSNQTLNTSAQSLAGLLPRDRTSVAQASGTANGFLTISADGSFVYTPRPGFAGTDQFSYRVYDGGTLGGVNTVTIQVTNGAPGAQADYYAVTTGVDFVSPNSLVDNDLDPDSDPMTVSLVQGPSHGRLTLNADGTFSYQSEFGFVGDDSFRYQAFDGVARGAVQNVTLAVSNSAPSALGESFSVTRGQAWTSSPGELLGNDYDADVGQTLTVALVSGVSHGSLSLSANGTLTYLGLASFVGTDQFSYKVFDGTEYSAAVTVSLDVPNSTPVANSNAYSVSGGAPVGGTLSTDDDDGDVLRFILLSSPAHGTLSLNADGVFSYAADAWYSGVDSFTYSVHDGAEASAPATVIFGVTATQPSAGPAFSPPVAFADAFLATAGRTLSASSVLSNDLSPAGSWMRAQLVTGASHGTLVLNSDGSFVYTPDEGFAGEDEFTYQSADGLAVSAVADVRIVVADAHPSAATDTYAVHAGTSLARDVTANDVDADGHPLRAQLVTGPMHGTLLLDSGGSFTYTPGAGYVGNDSFTYRLDAGTGSSVAIVQLRVTNSAPVAAPDAYGIHSGGTLSVGDFPLLANDLDVDGDALHAILVTGVSHGALVLNSNGTFEYRPDLGFTGTDSFTYKTSDGFSASNVTTVNLLVRNTLPAGGNESYSLLANSPGRTLGGYLVNYAADFMDGAGDLMVQSGVTYSGAAGRGVLGNDVDAEGQPLLARLTSTVAHGTLRLDSSGKFTYTPFAGYTGLDSFQYDVGDGASFSSHTVRFSVFNSAPNAFNTSYVIEAGRTLRAMSPANPPVIDVTESADPSMIRGTEVAYGGLLANSSDPDRQRLFATLVSGPAHGKITIFNSDGTFEYTPSRAYTGLDTFTFAVSDGIATVNATVNIRVTNDPPKAKNASFEVANGYDETGVMLADSVGWLFRDATDGDDDRLTARLITGPSQGSLILNSDGTFFYRPRPTYVGLDSFTFCVYDGAVASAPITVSISVLPPIVLFAQNDTYTFTGGILNTVPNRYSVKLNDQSNPGERWDAVLVTQAANGTVTLQKDGSFTYDAKAGAKGADSFTYQLRNKSGYTNVATVSLNVINTPPIAMPDSYAMHVNQTLSVAMLSSSLNSPLLNDLDPDKQPLTMNLVTHPQYGTLQHWDSLGGFVYVPVPGFTGIDSFTYQVYDNVEKSTPTTVYLSVYPASVTLPPPNSGGPGNGIFSSFTPDDDVYGVMHDQALIMIDRDGVAVNDNLPTDPNISIPPIDVVSWPTHGNLTMDSSGSFYYQPNAEYVGDDTFTYRYLDGTSVLTVPLGRVTIKVKAFKISGAKESYSVVHDTALVVNGDQSVLNNDEYKDLIAEDNYDKNLSAILIPGQGPANGTLNLFKNGTFTYLPEEGFVGRVKFKYYATDGVSQSNSDPVEVEINITDAPPQANNDAYVGSHDMPIFVTAQTSVINNDADADNDPFVAEVVAGPASGTLSFQSNGAFVYTPNANFVGADQFTYKLKSTLTNAESRVSTVLLYVTNDMPVARFDVFGVTHDTALTVNPLEGVLINDSDAENDALTLSLVQTTQFGALTLSAGGSFTYRPNAGFVGIDNFTYRLHDGLQYGNVATVTLYVYNEAPTLAPVASGSILHDTKWIVSRHEAVLPFADDANGDNLTITLGAGPSHGSVALSSSGAFVYTPLAGYTGADVFSVRVSDGIFTSQERFFHVEVAPSIPDADDETYSTLHDTPLAVSPFDGLLANDSDPASHPLMIEVLSQPGHGSVVVHTGGSFLYTPDAAFVGTDVFTYRVSNGLWKSKIATATLNVTNKPTRTLAETYTGDVNSMVIIPMTSGVAGNDEDDDGDFFTTSLVHSPAHGSVVMTAGGSFIYTPDEDFIGDDLFTYRANDGIHASHIVSATIHVRPVEHSVPISTVDQYQTAHHQSLIVPQWSGVLANDSSSSDDVLTSVLLVGPTHGALQLSASGSFVYLPDGDYVGSDSFVYRAFDGTASGAATLVTINVTNSAPQGGNDHYRISSEHTLFVDALHGLLFNDTDADGDRLTVTLIGNATNGTLGLGASGAFTYTPLPGFIGADSFTYRVSDGIASSGDITVTLLVASPEAVADQYFTGINQSLSISAPTQGVLNNDFSPTGTPLHATLVSQPSHGTLSLSLDGTFTYTPDEGFSGNDTFSYIARNYLGDSNPATVNITVDDSGTINGPGSNGTPVLPGPVANGNSYTVNQGINLYVRPKVGLLVNDVSPDGVALVAQLVQGPAHGTLSLSADGSFVYSGDVGFLGADQFTYRVSDGRVWSGAAVASLSVVNETPIGVADDYQIHSGQTLRAAWSSRVLANDTDAEQNPLTALLISGPAHGSLTLGADGTFIYQSSSGYVGSDTFTYQPYDGTTYGAAAVVTIHVVNAAPIAQGENYTVAHDAVLQATVSNGLLANDEDPDGDLRVLQIISGPANGTFVMTDSGAFTYRANARFVGQDTIVYRIFDGFEYSSSTTAVIAVTNSAPGAQTDAYSMNHDTSLVVGPEAGVLSNDADADGDLLNVLVSQAPLHGNLTLQPNGAFYYVPNAGYFGSDSFSYVADDGAQLSGVTLVTLNVANHAPTTNIDAYSVVHDGVLALLSGAGVLANDSDQEGDKFIAEIVTGPAKGTLTLSATGALLYTPNANITGFDTFTYRTYDGVSYSGSTQVTIEIKNAAPIGNGDAYTLAANSALYASSADGVYRTVPGTRNLSPVANLGSLTTPSLLESASTDLSVTNLPGDRSVLANDIDDDGDRLSVTLVVGPAYGTLDLRSNGAFVYIPRKDFVGADSFSYSVSDGISVSAPISVSLQVERPGGNGSGDPLLGLEVQASLNAYLGTSPGATTPLYMVMRGGVLSITKAGDTLLGRLQDPYSDTTVEIVSGPSFGTLTLKSNGAFFYQPSSTHNGSGIHVALDDATEVVGYDKFVFRLKYADGSYSEDVTAPIALVNAKPIATANRLSVTYGQTIAAPYSLLGNDFDLNKDALVVHLENGTPGLSLNAAGAFSYTAPATGANGAVVSATYYVTDSTGARSASTTITVTLYTLENSKTGMTQNAEDANEQAKMVANQIAGEAADAADLTMRRKEFEALANLAISVRTIDNEIDALHNTGRNQLLTTYLNAEDVSRSSNIAADDALSSIARTAEIDAWQAKSLHEETQWVADWSSQFVYQNALKGSARSYQTTMSAADSVLQSQIAFAKETRLQQQFVSSVNANSIANTAWLANQTATVLIQATYRTAAESAQAARDLVMKAAAATFEVTKRSAQDALDADLLALSIASDSTLAIAAANRQAYLEAAEAAYLQDLALAQAGYLGTATDVANTDAVSFGDNAGYLAAVEAARLVYESAVVAADGIYETARLGANAVRNSAMIAMNTAYDGAVLTALTAFKSAAKTANHDYDLSLKTAKLANDSGVTLAQNTYRDRVQAAKSSYIQDFDAANVQHDLAITPAQHTLHDSLEDAYLAFQQAAVDAQNAYETTMTTADLAQKTSLDAARTQAENQLAAKTQIFDAAFAGATSAYSAAVRTATGSYVATAKSSAALLNGLLSAANISRMNQTRDAQNAHKIAVANSANQLFDVMQVPQSNYAKDVKKATFERLLDNWNASRALAGPPGRPETAPAAPLVQAYALALAANDVAYFAKMSVAMNALQDQAITHREIQAAIQGAAQAALTVGFAQIEQTYVTATVGGSVVAIKEAIVNAVGTFTVAISAAEKNYFQTVAGGLQTWTKDGAAIDLTQNLSSISALKTWKIAEADAADAQNAALRTASAAQDVEVAAAHQLFSATQSTLYSTWSSDTALASKVMEIEMSDAQTAFDVAALAANAALDQVGAQEAKVLQHQLVTLQTAGAATVTAAQNTWLLAMNQANQIFIGSLAAVGETRKAALAGAAENARIALADDRYDVFALRAYLDPTPWSLFEENRAELWGYLQLDKADGENALDQAFALENRDWAVGAAAAQLTHDNALTAAFSAQKALDVAAENLRLHANADAGYVAALAAATAGQTYFTAASAAQSTLRTANAVQNYTYDETIRVGVLDYKVAQSQATTDRIAEDGAALVQWNVEISGHEKDRKIADADADETRDTALAQARKVRGDAQADSDKAWTDAVYSSWASQSASRANNEKDRQKRLLGAEATAQIAIAQAQTEFAQEATGPGGSVLSAKDKAFARADVALARALGNIPYLGAVDKQTFLNGKSTTYFDQNRSNWIPQSTAQGEQANADANKRESPFGREKPGFFARLGNALSNLLTGLATADFGTVIKAFSQLRKSASEASTYVVTTLEVAFTVLSLIPFPLFQLIGNAGLAVIALGRGLPNILAAMAAGKWNEVGWSAVETLAAMVPCGPARAAGLLMRVFGAGSRLISAAHKVVVNTVRVAKAAVILRNGGEAVVNLREGNWAALGTNVLKMASSSSGFFKSCFAAGTPILWEFGSKPIEQFQAGERVWARNETDPDGPLELKAIEEVFVRFGWIWNLHVGGQVIRTTGEHPFYVKGKGWVPAQELKPGDLLSTHTGEWIAVDDILETGEAETVYNFRVADWHTYFVGDVDWKFGAWAHNQYTGIQKVGDDFEKSARRWARKQGERTLKTQWGGNNGFDFISWTGTGKNAKLFINEVKAVNGKVRLGTITAFGFGSRGKDQVTRNVQETIKSIDKARRRGRIDLATATALQDQLRSKTAKVRMIGLQGATKFPDNLRMNMRGFSGFYMASGNSGAALI